MFSRLRRLPQLLAAARRAATHASPELPDATLHITDRAAARLHALAAPLLRVAVEGGGCSGFQYRFALGDSPEPEDRVFEHDGARVAVDPVSFDLLRGATIDYSQELIRAAFVVASNPQSATSCGCGTSFAAKT